MTPRPDTPAAKRHARHAEESKIDSRTTFSNRWLNREDSKIHRCSCGSWLYAEMQCTACGPQIPQACPQNAPALPVPFPRPSTGGVYGALSLAAQSVHADVVDHSKERRRTA